MGKITGVFGQVVLAEFKGKEKPIFGEICLGEKTVFMAYMSKKEDTFYLMILKGERGVYRGMEVKSTGKRLRKRQDY